MNVKFKKFRFCAPLDKGNSRDSLFQIFPTLEQNLFNLKDEEFESDDRRVLYHFYSSDVASRDA